MDIAIPTRAIEFHATRVVTVCHGKRTAASLSMLDALPASDRRFAGIVGGAIAGVTP
jgi:hypothetical protein